METKKFYRKFGWRLSTVGVLLLLATLGWGQTQQQTQAQPASPAQQQSAPGGDARPPQPQASATAEPKISPKEAEEFFRSVDEILKFVSRDTGLPIKQEVKKRLTSRDEVEAYLQKNMSEDKDAQRLRRSELVLKKFGLLPRDFNLETFLVALLKEQVAGYYDPKTKTVNLLNWLEIEQQRPVMAHELTHALQDQSFGLEKWMKAGDADLADKKQPTPEDIENDEINTARTAVVEGQAMAVMLDYLLAPSGQTLANSRELLDRLKEGMLVGTPDAIEFHNAPIYLREALTFPYRYGVDFEADLLASGGEQKAFAGAFANPPHTTRQIMEPKTYLSGERNKPMRLPDFAAAFKNYDRFDIGGVGEFDVALLVDQYAGVEASRELYPHWRGGYYYAARPKGDASAPLGLLYVSRWSTVEHAAEFAAIYAKSLPKRYQRAHEVQEGSNNAELDLRGLETLVGKHTWLTEEGPVVIVVQGDTVLVTESLDQATTDKLGHDVFAPATAEGK
ncbi:MAG: hypothetical protein LAN83_13130 [Acidobacteriia bacterium]|nr:hypothetical protein [Terriglobia bacterium]